MSAVEKDTIQIYSTMSHCCMRTLDLPDENRPAPDPYGYLRSLPDVSTSLDIARHRPALAFLNSITPTDATCEDIHPLFQQAQWVNLSCETYLQLLPALKVATQLTRQASSLSFHNHILHGELKYLKEKRRYYLAPSAYEATQTAHLMTTETLDITLPRYLRLEFDELDEDGFQFDAMTYFGEGASASEIVYCPRIQLHTHHLYTLRHVINHGSLYDQEAIFLRIAIALCHELAHAVWYHRSSIENSSSPTTTHGDPLYQLADTDPELGDAWERYTFGGNIWTIDYPGKITTYYYQLDATSGRSDYDTRIIVPRWWVHMFFLQPIWTYFSRLHHQGLLRLPTELESGCVFRKHSPEASMDWTMYIHGAKQEPACMMTRAVPYLLWNLLRPALNRLENCNRFEDGWERPSESERNREEYEEMCRSLVDQAAAPHTMSELDVSLSQPTLQYKR